MVPLANRDFACGATEQIDGQCFWCVMHRALSTSAPSCLLRRARPARVSQQHRTRQEKETLSPRHDSN